MNNIKKAVFYIIFKSKSTIFNMLGVGVLGTLMLVVFQQDQFYSKGTDYLILVFFVVLLGCTLLQANSIIIDLTLLGITIYKIGSPDVAQILDFFTFTLLSSIIINAVILVIRDMNKYKGISLRISVFYFFILIIESMFYSWSNNFILTVIIKYVISLCVSVFVLRMATKERIVMAYY